MQSAYVARRSVRPDLARAWRSRDVDLGPAFTGSFELTIHDAPGEELASLAPVEPIAGYWRQVGATFTGGEHLA